MVPNKKRDIYWWLYHKALPLGYRLRHVSRENNGDCPECTNEPQTTEHFMYKCEISRIVWEEAYKLVNTDQIPNLPTSREEVFQLTGWKDKRKWHSIRWLHIQAIYEIWCLYTKAKWGEGPLSPIETKYRVRARLGNEIKQLKVNLVGKSDRFKNKFRALTESF